jgi:2-oxoglutarate ferredoxin oxidoreductase subunit alpha
LTAAGVSVAQVHLRHLNPLPSDLGGILRRYKRVLVPEMNLGQLVKILRAEYAIDAIGYGKIQGRPFKVGEIVQRARKMLEERP